MAKSRMTDFKSSTPQEFTINVRKSLPISPVQAVQLMKRPRKYSSDSSTVIKRSQEETSSDSDSIGMKLVKQLKENSHKKLPKVTSRDKKEKKKNKEKHEKNHRRKDPSWITVFEEQIVDNELSRSIEDEIDILREALPFNENIAYDVDKLIFHPRTEASELDFQEKEDVFPVIEHSDIDSAKRRNDIDTTSISASKQPPVSFVESPVIAGELATDSASTAILENLPSHIEKCPRMPSPEAASLESTERDIDQKDSDRENICKPASSSMSAGKIKRLMSRSKASERTERYSKRKKRDSISSNHTIHEPLRRATYVISREFSQSPRWIRYGDGKDLRATTSRARLRDRAEVSVNRQSISSVQVSTFHHGQLSLMSKSPLLVQSEEVERQGTQGRKETTSVEDNCEGHAVGREKGIADNCQGGVGSALEDRDSINIEQHLTKRTQEDSPLLSYKTSLTVLERLLKKIMEFSGLEEKVRSPKQFDFHDGKEPVLVTFKSQAMQEIENTSSCGDSASGLSSLESDSSAKVSEVSIHQGYLRRMELEARKIKKYAVIRYGPLSRNMYFSKSSLNFYVGKHNEKEKKDAKNEHKIPVNKPKLVNNNENICHLTMSDRKKSESMPTRKRPLSESSNSSGEYQSNICISAESGSDDSSIVIGKKKRCRRIIDSTDEWS